MLTKDPLALLLLTVLATIPLLFGARHPLIQGGYSSLLLIACGHCLALNLNRVKPLAQHYRNLAPPLLLLLYLFATTLSLPETVVRILSPVRAANLSLAAQTIGAHPVTSLSYYGPETRFLALYLVALFLYARCASKLLRRDDLLTVALWIITAVGLVEAAYGLMQAMNPTLGVLWLPSEIGAEGCARGTIIYRNQYAAFLNLCWPMALIHGLRLHRRAMAEQNQPVREIAHSLVQRIGSVFSKGTLPLLGSAFMMLAVIFSRSRGGIAALALIAALLLLFLPFSRRLKGTIASTFLAFILIYGGLIGFAEVTARFLEFYEGALARIGLWVDSLSMLHDHPATGIGLGAYRFLSPTYLQNIPGGAWYDFAHNEYVELVIELGLPAFFLLLAWLTWQMGRRWAEVAREVRSARELSHVQTEAIVACGALFAILGFLLHGMVDFVWRLPANSFYAVTLLAILNAVLTPGAVDEQQP